MIKFFILLAMYALYISPATAQSKYSVYKIEGEAFIKADSDWKLLQKRTTVLATDLLNIKDEARVGILDNTSNRIFYSVHSGQQSVARIVSDAKKQADRVTGTMNEQIRKSTQVRDGSYSYQTHGASHRGQEGNQTTTAIYASLCRAIVDRDATAEKPQQIVLQKVPIEEDVFCFSVRNNSSSPLYINVLKLSKKLHRPQLCFNLGYTCDEPYMLIPANETVQIDHFIFVESGEEEVEYLLFGSVEAFDVPELQLLLDSASATPPYIDALKPLLFFYLK